MKPSKQDYRWALRFSDGGYVPDWAIEAEEDDDSPSLDEMEPKDITDRLIAICSRSHEK